MGLILFPVWGVVIGYPMAKIDKNKKRSDWRGRKGMGELILFPVWCVIIGERSDI
jgi:hypothetical protein